MARLTRTIQHLARSAVMVCTVVITAAGFLRLCRRSPTALAAENLFLRTQLALYQARHVKPRRATDAIRVAVVWLSPWCDWQPALTVVPPETFRRWRRQGVGLCWHWQPKPGRPPIPVERQRLIRQMARDNLTWGQRRIANELRLKLGLQVSPRPVRTYLPTRLHPAPGHRTTSQRWRTFVRHHAWDLIARGMASDLTRGRQALAAWMRGPLPRWRRPAVARRLRGIRPHDAAWLSPLSAPAVGLAVWSPVIVEVIRVDQRRPPDGKLPYTSDPGLATRVTSVDRFDGGPAGPTLGEWKRTSLHTRGAKPLSTGRIRVAPWRRAA